MENLRVSLGKKHQAGQRTKTEAAVATLDQRVANNANVKKMLGRGYSYSMTHWNDKQLEVSKVFSHTFKWCIDLNLYGEGPVCYEKKGCLEEMLEEQGETTMTLKGEPINADIVSSWSQGLDRAKRYFEKFYIFSRNQVKRSEADINLQLISSTVNRGNKEVAKLLIKKTSCCHSELEMCTKVMLAEEIETLRGVLPQRRQPPLIDIRKLSKPELKDILIKFRKIHFKRDKRAKDQIKDEIFSQHRIRNQSDLAARKDELKQTFYSLSEDIKEEYQQHDLHYTSPLLMRT